MQLKFSSAISVKNNFSKGSDEILRKSLKFIILFLFAVFIFWFFGRNLDWAEVSDSIKTSRCFLYYGGGFDYLSRLSFACKTLAGFARTDHEIFAYRTFCDDDRRFCGDLSDRQSRRNRPSDVASDARSGAFVRARHSLLSVSNAFSISPR